ncbi:MAG: YkgJ family cysteine cluster protein [Ardenticatenaceae bacterium]|nr:YkgJ family cysteine cluster protein [Anaerolineales bacterium]MCB8980523.1 YkgJ family cysteine cluster protein [Ardenticatenaceae bacterium]
MSAEHVCLRCGACCAYYRVSFYWAEADPAVTGTVPLSLTEKLNEFRRVMAGTNGKSPRCVALKGQIGSCVHCTIYEERPSPCREFRVAWEDGLPSPECDKARLAWGLPVLQPYALLPPEQIIEHRLEQVDPVQNLKTRRSQPDDVSIGMVDEPEQSPAEENDAGESAAYS